MKLLFYINTLYDGGAERVIANLSNRFSNDKYDVVLVTSYANLGDYFVEKGVKRVVLADNSLLNRNAVIRNIILIYRLRQVIKMEKPDIAISFMAEPNFRLLLAAPSKTKKTHIYEKRPKSRI